MLARSLQLTKRRTRLVVTRKCLMRLCTVLPVLVAACVSLALVATAIAKHGSPVRHLQLQVSGLDFRTTRSTAAQRRNDL